MQVKRELASAQAAAKLQQTKLSALKGQQLKTAEQQQAGEQRLAQLRAERDSLLQEMKTLKSDLQGMRAQQHAGKASLRKAKRQMDDLERCGPNHRATSHTWQLALAMILCTHTSPTFEAAFPKLVDLVA